VTHSQSILKTRFMAGTIALALLAGVAWSYARLAQSRASAWAAGQNLADCRQLAARIQVLRQKPAVAGAKEWRPADLSRRIEEAARTAQFADGSIGRIEPEPPRRVGESNYREVPTQVRFGKVTLQQILTFLHALGSEAPQAADRASALQLHSIRLWAPRGEETADRWTVESTLTYMIYPQR
jgi:hypothetical protein